MTSERTAKPATDGRKQEEAMTQSEASMSYVSGISDTPLLGKTIGQALDDAATQWAERPALIDRGTGARWTWRELRDKADAFAAGLLGLGLKPGDRIGIWSLNRAEWALTQFAAAKAGLTLVTINPAYRLTELEYALNLVGCSAIVTATQFKTSDYVGMLNALAPELKSAAPGALKSAKLPHLRIVIQIGAKEGGIAPGMIPFDSAFQQATDITRAEIRRLAEALQFDDPINIQFTSGTTGNPKGVTLSHHNILNNGYFVGKGCALTPEDKICIPVPLYHCFGMVMGNLAAVTNGCAMVYPGEGFDPLATIETIAAERCTAVYGVPTMFIAQLEHPRFKDLDFSSLRTGIMAGSPCPIELMKKVVALMHVRELTICYGMTETSPVSFQSAVDAPLERRVSTVGRIHPHLEVKIIDADGKITPRGVPGELCTRGYSVMRGYWNQADKTAEVLDPARWMHTGDLATIDDAGFCNIVGRIKDLVIRGGENVYPREVEEYLYRHPKIQDVQVFGVADQKYGEELCAWVRLKAGEALTEREVQAFCEGQIAHQKIPRYVRFVDAFPTTVTGKVQKFKMREAMEAELGVKSAKTA
jgi:fatty-acyl-CoA synthase